MFRFRDSYFNRVDNGTEREREKKRDKAREMQRVIIADIVTARGALMFPHTLKLMLRFRDFINIDDID